MKKSYISLSIPFVFACLATIRPLPALAEEDSSTRLEPSRLSTVSPVKREPLLFSTSEVNSQGDPLIIDLIQALGVSDDDTLERARNRHRKVSIQQQVDLRGAR